jgi:SET domain-containing protein
VNPVLGIDISNIGEISPRFPWGVFAKIPILVGTVIVEYKGERIINEQRLFRYGDKDHCSGRGRYVFDNNDGTFTDAENPLLSGIARYINATGPGEKSEANVEVQCRNGKLYIECIKYIHARTELLFDYGVEYRWSDGEHKSAITKLVPRRKPKT